MGEFVHALAVFLGLRDEERAPPLPEDEPPPYTIRIVVFAATVGMGVGTAAAIFERSLWVPVGAAVTLLVAAVVLALRIRR